MFCTTSLGSGRIPPTLAQSVADYLVTQAKALAADPRFAGFASLDPRQPDADGSRHSLHLVAALSAKAAPVFTILSADLLDRGDGRARSLVARDQHRVHAVDAAV